MHDLNSVTKFLYSLRNKGSKYGLERMEALAEWIENPEKKIFLDSCRYFNGKGSVCAMVSLSIVLTATKQAYSLHHI